MPGVWQNYGYDSHQYTNVRYPIPLDPPYVHRRIHAEPISRSLYIRNQKKAPKAYLNFEGVDSCFYVWVNGTYVGYSRFPTLQSEFDVTDAFGRWRKYLSGAGSEMV